MQVAVKIFKKGELSEKTTSCCSQSLHDHHVRSLMTAQVISIGEKSTITLFTLMRYLKVLIVIILEKIGSLFSKCQIALPSSPVLSTVLAHNDD